MLEASAMPFLVIPKCDRSGEATRCRSAGLEVRRDRNMMLGPTEEAGDKSGVRQNNT